MIAGGAYTYNKGGYMPTVDFTLADMRQLIQEEVPPIVEHIVEERVSKIIDERVPKIIDERVPKIIDELVPRIIDGRVPDLFNDFYDSNLGPVFESIDDQFDELRDTLVEIKTDIKGIKRIVRKHSSDIAELQANQGL